MTNNEITEALVRIRDGMTSRWQRDDLAVAANRIHDQAATIDRLRNVLRIGRDLVNQPSEKYAAEYEAYFKANFISLADKLLGPKEGE